MNWNNPSERARLAESLGTEAYNAAFQQHIKDDAVATVNGYSIVPVSSRFGRLFQVFGTTSAFSEQKQAEDFARAQEPR